MERRNFLTWYAGYPKVWMQDSGQTVKNLNIPKIRPMLLKCLT